MADRLYVSYRLRGFTAQNMLRHWEKMLRLFPVSPRNPANSVLRIQAISYSEPPLLEQAFPDPLDISEVLSCAREFQAEDNSYQLETWWGLWQGGPQWALQPARVTLACFGPTFEIDAGEHLQIDLGLEAQFLPATGPESVYYAQSNIKGLLHLVHTLDDALAVERRQLTSESGENFAEKLRRVLEG